MPKRYYNALLALLLGWLCVATQVCAMQFPLPPAGDDLFGQTISTQVQQGDDFAKIARRYDIGFYELVAANPTVDRQNPPVGTVLIVPRQYLIPHVARNEIVINLAAMRLYYFPQGKKYFYSYPIGIGRQDWTTPLGKLHIIQKIRNPVWIVPDSIIAYRKEQGDPVPKVVHSGPMNPLGYFALRLSKPTYLIHGTNEPGSVGRRSSAGCIHLYPEDIKQLFAMVKVGTHVLVINQPYIVGKANSQLYIEAHLPLVEQRQQLANVSSIVVALVNSVIGGGRSDHAAINWQSADDTVKDHIGVPTVIGKLSAPSAPIHAQRNVVAFHS